MPAKRTLDGREQSHPSIWACGQEVLGALKEKVWPHTEWAEEGSNQGGPKRSMDTVVP